MCTLSSGDDIAATASAVAAAVVAVHWLDGRLEAACIREAAAAAARGPLLQKQSPLKFRKYSFYTRRSGRSCHRVFIGSWSI